MTEQEQMDNLWDQFEKLYDNKSEVHPSEKRLIFTGFLMAKRSQPIVKLPKPDEMTISFNHGDTVKKYFVYDEDDIHQSLTAAGIWFEVEE